MAANSGDSGKYVLFFTPEAGVVPHFTAQCVMARILKEQGHRILMVRCQGVYERCPVMDMYLLPHTDVEANKKQVCGQCQHVAKLFMDGYGLESINLPDLLTPEIAAKISGVMANAPGDLRELSYEGIQFGKLCMMAVVHATKWSQFENVSPEIRETWKQYISSALTSYLLVESLCRQLPVAAIVNHEDYSPLVAGRLAGRKLGIPAVTMTIGQHMGGDRRRYQFFHIPAWGQAFLTLQSWAQFRELAIAPSQVKDAMDDVLIRFQATTAHVYSPQKTFAQGDFRDGMKIPKDRKLLVLFTSSLDELIAATSQQDAIDLPRVRLPQTFKDQIEWIKAVIEYVQKESGLYLVVRIHPREGVNKRDGVRSQHLLQLQKAFDREYENCTIVWPEMPVSSYDLAEIADLALVSWSTLGLELSRLGVPVLASTYGNAPRPWDDFHDWGPTPGHYFNKLKQMLDGKPSLEAAKHSFRWYILHYFGYTIDISDLIPAKDFHGLPPFKMPAAAEQIADTLVHGHEVLDVYKARLQSKQEDEDREAEENEVKRQMRRAIHLLLTKEERTDDFALILSRDENGMDALSRQERMRVERGVACFLWVRRGSIEYYFNGHVSKRYSPMALRMALMASSRVIGSVGNSGADQDSPKAAQGASWSIADNGQAKDLAEAGGLRDAGLLDQARSFILSCAAKYGESPEWSNFLGHLEFMEGDAAKAKRTLLDVVKRWPGFGKSHNNLAAIFWSEGEKERSLEHMSKALESAPDQRNIVMNGVRIMVAMGRREEARSLTDSYLRTHPADAGVLTGILDGVP